MTCTTDCLSPRPTQAHCGACHRTFGAVGGFDRHRRGDNCLDPAGLPMHRDARGIWRMDGRGPHADAHSVRSREPQTAEHGSGVPRYTPDGLTVSEAISGGGV